MTIAIRPPLFKTVAQKALSRLRMPLPRPRLRPSPSSPWWADPVLLGQLVPSAAFGACAAALSAGLLSLSLNSLDFLRVPLMMAMSVTLALLVLQAHHQTSTWERGNIALAAIAALGALVLWVSPEYIYGHDINGIIHRSILTSVLLVAVGLPGMCNAMFWVLGGEPSAWDTSRYPIVIVPVAIALFIYGAMLWKLAAEGMPALGWDLISQGYERPTADATFLSQCASLAEWDARCGTPGLRNYLLGTLLLIAMTAAIALPVGVGAGVCMAEFEGWVSTIVGFCTQMLRAISVFILGVIAFSIADWSSSYAPGDWRSDLFRGFHPVTIGAQTDKLAGHGSFLTASLILALLVIPVIARSTEEGFRSIPREIREGSVAVGATEGHAFLFLLMPWAIPNIITGVILGCAEAAGSVAILLFIAGPGEFGVGPLREATSLGFMIFFADRGYDTPYIILMGEYRFTAALLLLFITFTLSILAVVLKQKFGERYRGAMSNQ